ncbi:MAG: hypothetical protein RIR51_130 [Bacteroidota bacterium]
MKKFIFLITFFNVMACEAPVESSSINKYRTIITTDGEIDDVDTFIRMLLYSNEFQIEGLIYSSSQWHYKGDGKGTKFTSKMEMTKKIYGERTELRWPGTEWMNPLLEAYNEVYPNLVLHSADYPKPEYLKSIVRIGNIDFEGEMEKITPGSEFIKEKLMDETTEPIYLQAWGGTNTIARALKSIEEENKNKPNWEEIQRKINQKAIIYTILDQDDTYQTYISKAWPDILVYYNSNQFWSFAYFWQRSVPKEYHPYFEGEFMSKIILNNGPLLKQYYSWGDGQKQAGDPEHYEGDISRLKDNQFGKFGQYDFLSEGDSPAFLQLVNTGLENTEHPNYGGWGGRFKKSGENPRKYVDAEDFNPFSNKIDSDFPQARWAKDMQMDFAARAEWCVKSFEEANHAPKIRIKEGNHHAIKIGDELNLTLMGNDVDQDEIKFSAFSYAEVGNGAANISVEGERLILSLPESATSGDEYHIVVEGQDNGSIPLKGYQRIILKVL